MPNKSRSIAVTAGQTYVLFAHRADDHSANIGELDLVDPTTGEVLYSTPYDWRALGRAARFVRKRKLVPAVAAQ